MKAFFEGIQTLFVDYLFAPWDFFRHLELRTWFGASTINWIFMAICAGFLIYWCKQLKLHEDRGEENHDPKAHSFFP
jgi:hypothetical protein